MKLFKKTQVFSNGSYSFCYELKISVKNSFTVFQKHDDKNFYLNQKKITSSIDSENSLYYKKRYLK
jgi:hypothetical protein